MARKPNVLIVEDDAGLRRLLTLNLQAEGYNVRNVSSAEEAEEVLLVEGHTPDAIILDIMLPGTDGYAYCRSLRNRGYAGPIVMLTARSLKDDRVMGYDSGADAYLVKPFELDELLAVLRAQLRRSQLHVPEPRSPVELRGQYQFGDVFVDFDAFTVHVRGETKQLTPLELKLLKYFIDNPGRVLTRDELLRSVWEDDGFTGTRTVDNFVSRLRRHIERDPSRPRHIISVRGAGYRFVPEPADS